MGIEPTEGTSYATNGFEALFVYRKLIDSAKNTKPLVVSASGLSFLWY